ncbi:MAG: hypothetical protein C0490_01025 [Marivirga sp.]|nr:hypothetical protein [Marivirga sp.]
MKLLFPDGFNTYDSYGEGLANIGKKEEAIYMYKKFPLVLMCCIALFTVGYHTCKTACVDPAKSLRAE